MANHPGISPFSAERARQLRQRAQDQITRTQRLTEIAREIQAYAASLRAECAMVLDEVRVRQSTLR